MVFLSSVDQCPYFLMRTIQDGNPWFSLLGAHELCIEREGSALQLKRWSRSGQCSKLWAALYFLTWEGKDSASHGPWSTPLTPKRCRDGAILLHLRRSQGPQHVDGPGSPKRIQASEGEAPFPSVGAIPRGGPQSIAKHPLTLIALQANY